MRVRRLVGATVLAAAVAIVGGAGTAAATDGPHGRDSGYSGNHDGKGHGWLGDGDDDGWEVEGHYGRRGEHGHFFNIGGPYGLTHAGGGKFEKTGGFELERGGDHD
ncbi:hypothetical protein GCM10010145_51220 [Streptomyces ruber]|uniref:Uncharacterized protein n=2 Tax=Streptomyces TaxID=1883 RepID=A0A918BN28_9ACTN|nr:hypothetical protein [Streptomyces ruber]GGQ75386.1 hypothetical protein GCM10010145_51220 [Streptomyces ruber]